MIFSLNRILFSAIQNSALIITSENHQARSLSTKTVTSLNYIQNLKHTSNLWGQLKLTLVRISQCNKYSIWSLWDRAKIYLSFFTWHISFQFCKKDIPSLLLQASCPVQAYFLKPDLS